MDNQQICLRFVILLCIIKLCYGQYQIPELTFEAFTPRGLRISMPADEGVELFAFHGKINEPILQIEPGEISQDVTKPTNGRFIYIDTALKLNEKDVINYWVFVQHDQLGFRKEGQSWTVNKLLPQEDLNKGIDTSCTSITKVEGEAVCPGDAIINYKFSQKPIESEVWITEQYIPGFPDWQFNIYRDTPDVVDIENNVLRIRPKLEAENAKLDLNLNPGCTRRNETECAKQYVAYYNPPVVSGKLQSRKAFCFANITIRAKLPTGDYMFPQIYLEDISKPQRRILIAYARGNKNYIEKNGIDNGGKKLFGGPYTNVVEPHKSKYLSTHQSAEPIGDSWHTFNLIWKPNVIDMFIDGQHFGNQEAKTLQATEFNQDRMVRLVLGVGVGGPYEFPDGYTSSGQDKPYRSTNRNAIKQFLNKQDIWINTWTKDSQMQVDYVSVTAL